MRLNSSMSLSWLALASLAAKRRTPIPTQTVFAAGNAGPTPLPSAAENEYRTFTVGATHLVSPSSVFWCWLNTGICSLRTVRIASGESQD
ncbi:hypothetical protein BJV77DRAFT_1013145 [Russula vinacea]|nr:hypothetical protein BJV77DRAFT_1013145 [Russula vinacea]